MMNVRINLLLFKISQVVVENLKEIIVIQLSSHNNILLHVRIIDS